MKRTILNLFFAMLALSNANGMEHNDYDSIINQSKKQTKSYISIFEIPATDIKRAINFYEAILDINIEHMEMPGMEMGILPYENQQVIGVIMKGEGYEPSAKGVTIYLSGGDDLQVILEKVEQNGGSILVPKTPHADESGFFALFIDSEGNKMGLHSPK
ncbi:VOC family protein [uncultured Allomuricauda sp.]|uniref:VOC family protein n=1 Tax=Flagellimonas sp. W118 TaxID=3410791 RepID=UPI002631CE0F|nr:VOC family protein [uncultured Allomuricauda sp.]